MSTWRTPAENEQVFYKVYAFTHTMQNDNAANIVTVSTRMQEINKITIAVDTFDAYINFDGDATRTSVSGTVGSLLVPAGTSYSEEKIYISTRISAINATTGSNARIRGVIWGR